MSRRRSTPSDSLELLLDTLCNTFGGVLFIAMLVVVMLQMAGNVASRRPPSELVRSEDLEDLADELEVLTVERETLAGYLPETTDGLPNGDGTGDARRRLAESLTRLKELELRTDRKLVEAGRLDASALAASERLAGLDGGIARARREAQELREQIDRARKANARAVHTPLMHRSGKTFLGVELRYGRLYVVHEFGPSGERLGPNREDYVLLDTSGAEIEVTANPARGLPVAAGPSFKMELRRRLSRFPPQRWALDLAVRDGSFGSFHLLKEATRAAGYEMRILLLGEDGTFRDRGGTRSEVQ